jgi:hypothetical protein
MIGKGAVTTYELAPDAMSQLATMFAEDAAVLRVLVGEQGTSTGRPTMS